MPGIRDGSRPRDARPTYRMEDGRPRTIRPATGRPDAASRPDPAPTSRPDPAPTSRPTSAPKSRPDPRPLRIAFGLGAVATASALLTALASPSGGAAAPAAETTVTVPGAPAASVRHVTRYVQLQPGQTAPPQAAVQQATAPPPRVVIVRTRQSGTR
jgi:hypothetical protein